MSRRQRNAVLSCSINVNVGGSQSLGSRCTVLENGYAVKEGLQTFCAKFVPFSLSSIFTGISVSDNVA